MHNFILSNWLGTIIIVAGAIGFAIQLHTYYLLRTGKNSNRLLPRLEPFLKSVVAKSDVKIQVEPLQKEISDHERLAKALIDYITVCRDTLVEHASRSGITEQGWRQIIFELKQKESRIENIIENDSDTIYFNLNRVTDAMQQITPQLNHATQELIEEQAEQAQQLQQRISELEAELQRLTQASITQHKITQAYYQTIDLLLYAIANPRADLSDLATRTEILEKTYIDTYEPIPLHTFFLNKTVSYQLREITNKRAVSQKIDDLIHNATNLRKVAEEQQEATA